MPRADFFRRFGLFVQEGFFEPEWCRKRRLEMDEHAEGQGTIVNKEGARVVDTNIRTVRYCDVSQESLSFARDRVQTLKPLIEKSFRLNLKGFQPLQWLKYHPGDFYRPHFDRRADEHAIQTSKERLVSVVIFLNEQKEETASESYAGGALTLYGLLDDPAMVRCGFPLAGETGLLVAFRSDLLHEVTPVTDGNRYTIVTWFY